MGIDWAKGYADTILPPSRKKANLALWQGCATICPMDVVAIQNELESLPSDQQDRISAFVTALRMKRQGLMAEITRRLDDDDTGKWVSWDEVKTDLDGDSSE